MKEFECWDCHRTFHADESKWVECPHCHSDNVEYRRMHISRRYVYSVVAIMTILPLLYIIYNKISSSTTNRGEEIEYLVTDTTDSKEIEYLDSQLLSDDVDIEIPPTIAGVLNRELDDNNNYQITLKLSHIPKIDFYVALLDYVTCQEIARSKDGKFLSVPYSKNGGNYYAQIFNANGDTISAKITIPECVEVKAIDSRMSKEKLQELINSQDPSLLGHENKYLSPTCVIKYSNVKGDELPTDLADVFEWLDFGTWSSVHVVSLEYDNSKHISTITLKVDKK